MNKEKFLSNLKNNLLNLSSSEIQERLNFYSEMIDDLIEEGLSEEEAVNKIGNVNKISNQIVTDVSLNDVVEEKIKVSKKTKGWQIALLIIGSPILFSLFALAFSLIIAVIAITFSLICSLYAVVISLWAVAISLTACAFAGVIGWLVLILHGYLTVGFTWLSCGLICGGLSIFTYYGCKALTKATVLLNKKLLNHVKTQFNKRRKA